MTKQAIIDRLKEGIEDSKNYEYPRAYLTGYIKGLINVIEADIVNEQFNEQIAKDFSQACRKRPDK